MYKEIILSKIPEYIKLKKWKYKPYGKLYTLLCPYCKDPALTARVMAHSYNIKCLNPECTHKKKFTLISIVRANEKDKEDRKKVSPEDILNYLKDLLNIQVFTEKDEKEIEEVLQFYKKNNWAMLPLVKNENRCAVEKWNKKEYRDIDDWRKWVAVNKMNLGVRTGEVNNIIDIDIDTAEIPEEIKPLLNDTLNQKTNRGWHYIYQYEEIRKGSIYEFVFKSGEKKIILKNPNTKVKAKDGIKQLRELKKNEEVEIKIKDKLIKVNLVSCIKIDVESDGGIGAVFPTIIDGYTRRWTKLQKPAKMSPELKEWLTKRLGKRQDEDIDKVLKDIQSSDYKMPLIGENEGRNELFIRLGGKLLPILGYKKTAQALYILDNTICEPVLGKELNTTVLKSLKNYDLFDEEGLADEILAYIVNTKGALRTEIIQSFRAKYDSQKVVKVLSFLEAEERIIQKGGYYTVLDDIEWTNKLINVYEPIDFKMPYFNDIANFAWGDIILIGGKTGTGKSHIAMNIIKQLVNQGKKPRYIPREPDMRFVDIALQLGMKEGDFDYPKKLCLDPTKIKVNERDIVIIDWLLPKDFSKTDKTFDKLSVLASQYRALFIVFVQLRGNEKWFASDLTEQLVRFSTKYLYDDENDTTYGHFDILKVTAGRRKRKNTKRTVSCRYDWDTKRLIRIDEEENNNEVKEEDLKDEKIN